MSTSMGLCVIINCPATCTSIVCFDKLDWIELNWIGKLSWLFVGSPYRDLISDAILKLQEDQMLQMLYDKWWKEYGGAGKCDTGEEKVRKDANALTIANVGGVFVVLIVGLLLSPCVAAFEFVWKVRRRRRRRRHGQSAAIDPPAVLSADILYHKLM